MCRFKNLGLYFCQTEKNHCLSQKVVLRFLRDLHLFGLNTVMLLSNPHIEFLLL